MKVAEISVVYIKFTYLNRAVTRYRWVQSTESKTCEHLQEKGPPPMSSQQPPTVVQELAAKCITGRQEYPD